MYYALPVHQCDNINRVKIGLHICVGEQSFFDKEGMPICPYNIS